MHVLIETFGSAGDVHPFVGIGRELRARGHDVTLATSPLFEDPVRQAGLAFVALGDAAALRSLAEDPRIWDPRRGTALIVRRGALPQARAALAVLPAHIGRDTVLVGSTLALGVRLLRETLQVPLVTVHLAPALFRSVHRAPRMPGIPLQRHYPPVLNAALFGLVEWYLDRLFRPELDQLLRSLGRAPVRHVFYEFLHSPDAVLAMFPDWFAAPQPGWPSRVRCAGFPLFDGGELLAGDAELQAWMQSGDPPIVFTAGSANLHAEAFFRESLAAAQRLRRRALLVNPAGGTLGALPAFARETGFVPFSAVLPHAAAFVSHGGIGSCAQALAAGVPHLVRWLAFDQLDNASRLTELGTGAAIAAGAYTGRRAAAALRDLLDDAAVQARAGELAGRLDPGAARRAACEAIEAARFTGESMPRLRAER